MKVITVRTTGFDGVGPALLDSFPAVDFLVIGEGEVTFAELISSMATASGCMASFWVLLFLKRVDTRRHVHSNPRTLYKAEIQPPIFMSISSK